jgi:hypothetical protein
VNFETHPLLWLILKTQRASKFDVTSSPQSQFPRLWCARESDCQDCLIVGDYHVATRDADACNGKRCACLDAIELAVA